MIGKKLIIVPSVIKRSTEVKELHTKEGIPESKFVFNRLTLPEDSEQVKAFQAKIANAYDELSESISEAVIEVVGEEQFSTMVSLAKDAVMENPFPASIQSLAHRTNLTDADEVTVWEVKKSGATTSKANLASGLTL
jgi:hypothetical protein